VFLTGALLVGGTEILAALRNGDEFTSRSDRLATTRSSSTLPARTLGVDVALLCDWNGEAARAFGVAFELLGMFDVPARRRSWSRTAKSCGRRGCWMRTCRTSMP